MPTTDDVQKAQEHYNSQHYVAPTGCRGIVFALLFMLVLVVAFVSCVMTR